MGNTSWCCMMSRITGWRSKNRRFRFDKHFADEYANGDRMTQDQEIVTEFIIETNENLTRLSQDLVAIESRPKDAELLASIFRTFHTIKGTTGFLGFTRLESLTHIAENILSQVRKGERDLTPELVSLILECTDVVRGQLTVIEATGQESPVSNEELEGRLRRFAEQNSKAPVENQAARNRQPL
jgi:chemotaxis protein histidine kinase CheA